MEKKIFVRNAKKYVEENFSVRNTEKSGQDLCADRILCLAPTKVLVGKKSIYQLKTSHFHVKSFHPDILN